MFSFKSFFQTVSTLVKINPLFFQCRWSLIVGLPFVIILPVPTVRIFNGHLNKVLIFPNFQRSTKFYFLVKNLK